MKYKKIMIIIISLTVFLGLVITILPEAVRYIATKALRQQGLEHVKIEDIDINPFRAEIVIKNIRLELADNVVLFLHEARLEKDWKPLFDKKILINELTLTDAQIVIEKKQNGLSIAGINNKKTAQKSSKETPLKWQVGIKKLQLQNAKVSYRSAELNQDFIIKKLVLTDLYSWKPQQAGHLILDAQIDETRIKTDLNLFIFSLEKIIKGEIEIKDLALNPYAKIAGFKKSGLAGNLNLKLVQEIKINQNNQLNLQQKGTITLDHLLLKKDGLNNKLKNLAWQGDLTFNLKENKNWQLDWQGQLNLAKQSLKLKKQAIEFKTKKLKIKGQGALVSTQQINFNFKGNIKNSQLEFHNPEITIKPFSLNWKGGVKLTQNSKNLDLKLNSQLLNINKMALNIPSSNLNLSPLTIDWKGNFNLQQRRKTGLDVDWNGNFNLKNLNLRLADLITKTKTFNYQGQGNYHKKQTQKIHLNGKIKNKNFSLKNNQVSLNPLDLNWDGKLNLTLTNQTKVDWKGLLTLNHLDINLPKPILSIRNQQFNYQGEGRLVMGENLDYLIVGGLDFSDLIIKTALQEIQLAHFKGQQLQIEEPLNIQIQQMDFKTLKISQETQKLAEIKAISAQDLNIKGTNKIKLKQLEVTEIQGLDLINLQQLIVKNIQLKEMDLQLEQIDLKKLMINIELNKQGKIEVLNNLTKDSKSTTKTTKTKEKTSNPPFRIRFTEFNIDNQSRIDFKDHSVSPAFSSHLALQRFIIKDFDNQAKKMQTGIDIKSKLNKYAHLKIKGVMGIINQQLDMKIKAKIKGLELPILSPYSKNAIGYTLKKGQLNADINVKITQGKMDILNKLKFSKLEIKPFAGAKNKLEVPLETGLAMLKDKHDQIALDLPITGNIKDPKFRINDVINLALGKATKMAALTAVAFAIQPYGAILVASQMIDSNTFAAKLDAIEFKAGTLEPIKDPKDYIKKLATMLTDRPAIQLSVCGVVTAQDKEALLKKDPKIKISDQQLKKMARQRTELIKNLFLKEYNTEPDRLIGCSPFIETDLKAKARVDIGL